MGNLTLVIMQLSHYHYQILHGVLVTELKGEMISSRLITPCTPKLYTSICQTAYNYEY